LRLKEGGWSVTAKSEGGAPATKTMRGVFGRIETESSDGSFDKGIALMSQDGEICPPRLRNK